MTSNFSTASGEGGLQQSSRSKLGEPSGSSSLEFASYGVTWLAQHPELPAGSKAEVLGPTSSGSVSLQHPFRTQAQASVGAALYALSLVQMAMSHQPSSTPAPSTPATGSASGHQLQLETHGAHEAVLAVAPASSSSRATGRKSMQMCLPAGIRRVAEAAGHWALVRAADLEQPSQTQHRPVFQALDLDMLNPAALNARFSSSFQLTSHQASPPSHHTSSPGSVFGEKVRGQVRTTAVLLPIGPMPSSSEAMESYGSSCVGVVAVAGGMGALGALSAKWVGFGGLGTGPQLVLMGRSGRSPQAGALELAREESSDIIINLLACDASAAEDAAFMTSSQQTGTEGLMLTCVVPCNGSWRLRLAVVT